MEKKTAAIRRKQNFVPGRRYRGSATINEYGEIDFRAYQRQEESANAMRKVCEADGESFRYAIYRSEENVKIALLVPRGDAREIERRLRDLFIKTLLKLKEYEL
ncbi:MAG: hypothetical protein IKP91_11845 [Bacteroidaceae bacterium]|nr:hypothetical protein [Bacteroidaceae bacterium]